MKHWALGVPFLFLAGCGAEVDQGFIGAVRGGNTSAIQELLKQGADPNMTAGVNNWPALMHAVHKGRRESVRLLLAAGADVNLGEKGGYTPLMMAAGYGYDAIAGDLLRAGADPRRKLKDGTTALDLAVVGVPDIDRFTVGACQTETVRALLDAAPDVKFRPAGLDRAVFNVKRGGCRPVTELLAARNAF